jgi:hypothetical protein
LAIELDAQKLARLSTLDAEALESLSETLVRNCKWPE